MGLFDNARSVVRNGKIVNSITTANGGVIYQNQWSTSLTIDVPLNITYSDAFNISGTLKDRRNNLLIGETVKLKVGSTVVDTTTTNSNGEYSFTHTPVSTGNHSFQVIYEGSLSYDASESAIVTREVGKETTIFIDKSTYDGSSQTIKGQLVTDDGEPLAHFGVGCRGISDSGETWQTHTTDSNGNVVGISNNGQYNYCKWEFSGNSNYAPCSLVIPYDPPVPTVLTVSSDKDIISYADSESCTVTAKILDQNGSVMSGVSLDYELSHGDTIIDSGTGVTDSNGEVSVQYSATGVGDVTFMFEYGSLLQETYEVLDLYYYDTQTVDKSKYAVTQGSATLTYSDNGLTVIGTSSSGDTYVENTVLQLPTNYSLECQITNFSGSGGNYGGLCLDNLLLDFRSVNTTMYTLSPLSSIGTFSAIATNDILRIEKNNGVINIYINDVLKSTQNISSTGIYKHRTYNGRSLTVKNLKVKAL